MEKGGNFGLWATLEASTLVSRRGVDWRLSHHCRYDTTRRKRDDEEDAGEAQGGGKNERVLSRGEYEGPGGTHAYQMRREKKRRQKV